MSDILNQVTSFGRSEKYKVITTQNIIDHLLPHGYQVSNMSLARVNKKEKQGFQKHVVRLRHPAMVETLKSFPEIVIVNSYDGTTGVKLMLGVYRLVCANGLVVGSTFQTYNLRHTGHDLLNKVLVCANELLASASKLSGIITHWGTIQLGSREIQLFLEKASRLALPEDANPVNLRYKPYRFEDTSFDLWTVFNVIQERTLRGGFQYRTIKSLPNNDFKVVNGTTREVKSLDRIIELNKTLWDMAESFSKAA